MSTTKHTLETSWRDDDVEIGFTFTPGYPGDRIDPPCPDEIEVAWAFYILDDGKREACPENVIDAMNASADLHHEMARSAAEDCKPDPDAARDAAFDAVLL